MFYFLLNFLIHISQGSFFNSLIFLDFKEFYRLKIKMICTGPMIENSHKIIIKVCNDSYQILKAHVDNSQFVCFLDTNWNHASNTDSFWKLKRDDENKKKYYDFITLLWIAEFENYEFEDQTSQ